jgi:hypothetical protein
MSNQYANLTASELRAEFERLTAVMQEVAQRISNDYKGYLSPTAEQMHEAHTTC